MKGDRAALKNGGVPPAAATDLEVIHSSFGRLRVHLPRWSGGGRRQITTSIRNLTGVTSVEANPITGNILILYKPRLTTKDNLLAGMRGVRTDGGAADAHRADARSAVIEEKIGKHRRARIPVRGMNRDPGLAQRVVQTLETHGVHAEANPLTGRVQVDYDEQLIHIEDLLAEVAHLELPILPGEDEPAHPLDPRPLVRSATRAIGAMLGLGFVTVQGLVAPTFQGYGPAAAVAGFFNLFHAVPAVHKGLHRLLGPTGAEVASHGVTIVALTAAELPLGLVLAGAEALLLLSVVTQRRAAWRRYEDSLDASTKTAPGAILRLEPGMRLPRDARIVEGTGTALSRSGGLVALSPGVKAPGGARLAGGPFVCELVGGENFAPQPRPAPLRRDLHRRYLHYAAPISFVYAAGIGLATGSLSRAFEAMLLFNPYPALVGAEASNLAAASRSLRAGLTLVGSRGKRPVRLPDYLLIDGPQVLTDVLEINTVLPLDEDLDVPHLLALAGGVASAAGSPWGVFPPAGNARADNGIFNGEFAAASVRGVRFLLGPAKKAIHFEDAVDQRHNGGCLLVLARETDGKALGLVALRPRREAIGEVIPGRNGAAHRLEITTVLPLDESIDAPQLLALAGGVAAAAESPWGGVFSPNDNVPACKGEFNGLWAAATFHGVRYTFGPPEDPIDIGEAVDRRAKGGYLLVLTREADGRALGMLTLRPRLSRGVRELVEACRTYKVKLEMLPGVSREAAEKVAARADVTVCASDNAAALIRARQAAGAHVAFLSDGAHGAEGFALCDLGIGMAAGHSGYFPAQADILAPDLIAVSALIETGQRRERAVRESVGLSLVCNVLGLAMSSQGALGYHVAFIPGYIAALLGMGTSLFRLRGGTRPESALSYLVDPRPERWGHRPIPNVLRAFHTTEAGLSTASATRRQIRRLPALGREELLAALGKQFRAPTMSLMAGGACLTLVLGQPLNTALISTTLTINILAGLWQERQVHQGSEAVQRLAGPSARVVRDGHPVTIKAADLVTGDVILLMKGDRIPADARLLEAEGLEVDEAVLTGEAHPVTKGPTAILDHNRIVLEGTEVVVGQGRAVVVAVGRHTRLGATAAAMNVVAERESPLGSRLARVLRVALPVALTGGAITAGAGLAYGTGPAVEMITLGVVTALSTIPEGLPILAGVGQAAVSRRLAKRNALVRRLAGIEALGRVDVACSDKTGTLTEGRLSVSLVADLEQEFTVSAELPENVRHIVLTAGLASPDPDDPKVYRHHTDVAIVEAAQKAGVGEALRAPRDGEAPFDSARGFYAARVAGRLCIKGAPERILPRCVHAAGKPLDDSGRRTLLERVSGLAQRGLRVLLVAEGPADAHPLDPQRLNVLGFVCMSDSLRPSAAQAVARCQEAGIRVMMITGDHLETARTIAAQAGMYRPGTDEAVTAADLHELPTNELDLRLERVAVVARATPVDKVRIIESLRRRGHTVAMTGDGVNDAPALRLADVGVAMGKSGTEAARQASDVILADDEFSQLAEALVEGRSFWRNMRHSLGLLLGGNAGELGLIVGITAAGHGAFLNAAQIWTLSLLTDALPSLTIALRPPQQRNLSRLSREGLAGLDKGLPFDTFRRAVATGGPSLAAYLWTTATAGPVEAGAVTFASLICTQLAQTIDVGHSQAMLSRSSLVAVAGSLAAMGFVLGVPPVTELLGLVAPTAQGWGTVAASSAASIVVSRSIGVAGNLHIREWLTTLAREMRRLPVKALPAPIPPALPAPA